MKTEKAGVLIERSLKVSPGPHSNLRKPMGAGVTVVERTEGCHLWDVDGNEYLDYMMGIGPGILGHINQELQHRHRTLMLDRGVLMMWGGRWYVTSALLDSDIDRTLEVFDQSLAAL